ncbi:MAG: hypothetical protein ACK4NR_03430 [Micavibrio sp.]
MVIKIIKVILFLMVNAAGFYAVPTIIVLATKFNMMPYIEQDADLEMMRFLLFTATIPLWACTALASVGYFITSGELRSWLLLAPMYVMILYGISVIGYYHLT